MALTQEQINAIRQKAGYTGVSPVSVGQQNYSGQNTTSQVPFSGARTALDEIGQKRGTEALRSFQAYESGQQGAFRTGGQVAGQVLGGAADIGARSLGALLKAVTPNFIEKPAVSALEKGVGAVVSSPLVRPLVAGAMNLQEQNTPATRDIKALLGATDFVTSIATGGAASKAERAAKKQAAKVATTLEANKAIKTIAKQKKVTQKAISLFDKAVDVAPKTKKQFEEKTGKTVSEFLVEHQLPVSTKTGAAGNVLDTTEAVAELKRTFLPETHKVLDKLLETSRETFSLAELQKEAIQAAKRSKVRVSAKKMESIIDNMKSFIEAERRRYGDVINGKQLNQIKQGMWREFEGDSALKNAAREIGFAALKKIDETYKNPLIKQLNKQSGEFQNAVRILSKLDGSTVRMSGLGKKINQLIGAGVGSGVPLVGPLAGAYAAGKYTDFITNPSRITKKALEGLKQAGVVPESIKTIEAAQKFIIKEQKRLVKEFIEPNVPLLPAGGSVIEGQAPGILQGQQKLRDLINRK